MKVKLIRDAKIRHKAGETVEVSPAEAEFLIAVGSAAPAPVKKKTSK
jgi:hypothetical protein